MAEITNEREIRGMRIAALFTLTRKGNGAWRVPAQTTGMKPYTVKVGDKPTCSCPDHGNGHKCKHIFAVEYVMLREKNGDGTETVTEQVTIKEQITRPTYPQNWAAYNAAQTNEKDKFLELLHNLCAGIQEPIQENKTGRPRLRLSDAMFAVCYKIYSTVSGRRFMSDLRDAQAKGFIEKTPHFNSIFNYLENPNLTGILHKMIIETSLPLKAIEQDFACDASGFTTSRFIRWYDHRYGRITEKHEWVKVHLMCGVKTNVVTAVEIAGKDASSTPMLPDLLKTTAKNFKPREVSGDKEFGSLRNYDAIEAVGATPFIPFKSIHTGKGGGLWAKMYHFFQYHRDEFLAHYHKRSNVESTFSMIKAKFRDHIRSKTDVAMMNEVLCKIVCHNICVLIQEMFELGIEPTFWAEKSPAQISA
ncbi:Transposase DDE domain protein [Phycisphaerae bacterium RAS2]|nr:Transposase DDE domain protein [Phycisphaerae bacterium RAS2]